MSNSAVHLPGDFGANISTTHTSEHVPNNLRRATARLQFTPSYIVVGIYRLVTDRQLFVPAWKKCEHGVVRGLAVGLVWATMTFKAQRYFVEAFLINSPRVTGLSKETVLGFRLPFDLSTYATLFFISSQITAILTYFISHGLRIARERAYAQTIDSRGKGPDFWRSYVEEWDNPPKVTGKSVGHWVSGTFGRIAFKLLLMPVETVPLVGIMISAWLRSLGTARYLHKLYFHAKGMTREEVSVFIEERKWDYRAFGFAAALLERLPIIGLIFSVSNQVGAAMWAVDLEKIQHYVAEAKTKAEQ